MLVKCFMVLANLSNKWNKCLGMLVNAVENLTNVLRMNLEHGTYVTNLHNTHCGYFSLSNVCQPLSIELISLQICTYCLYLS